jgi:hypothetical protein
MRQNRNAYAVLVCKLEGRGHLKELGVGRRIILQHILQKYDWRM